MCNVLIIHFFFTLFGAEWEAKALIGSIPSFEIHTRDSIRFKELQVAEAAVLWDNFQKDYLSSRGRYPKPEGYSTMHCDNIWVHNTGLEIPAEPKAIKLYVLSSKDRFYYTEIIAPL